MEDSNKQFNQPTVETEQDILVKELKEKLGKAYNTNGLEVHEKVIEYTDKLKEKYQDYFEYRLWHLVTFSTISEDMEITHFDFPGDDSVEKFIKSL